MYRGSTKKERSSTEKAFYENVKSNGRPRLPAFDRLKSFSHDDLTVKQWCAQSLLMLMGSKFDKDDQAANN